MSKHVVMVVKSSVYGDVRALAAARALATAGYQVAIYGEGRRANVPTHTMLESGIDVALVPVVATWRHVFRGLWQLLRGDIGQTTVNLKSTNLLSLFFFNLWLLRLLWARKIDILHCHNFPPYPAAWLLAKLKRAKLVYDAHENAPSLASGGKARLVARVESWLLPRTDAVITVGERLADALKARGAREVVVVGNWKRAQDYRFDEQALTDKRAALGLSDYAVIITYLGSLDPNRSLLPLLEAVAQSPDVGLLIGGRGSLEQDVQAAAQRFPNVRFLGWVDEREAAMCNALADAIYCCLREDAAERGGNVYFAMPNKLFEAFAAGKPTLATRGVGEMSEVLERNGAGILLDEVTPETLKGVFAQLQDPATLTRLQAAARQAGQIYHWDVAAARLLAAYEELAGA